jgi:hypothetical protein
VSPSLLLLDLMLEFRPGARGSCRISMAFGMLPATFFGEIEVIDEMGICRYSQAHRSKYQFISYRIIRTESVPWFLARQSTLGAHLGNDPNDISPEIDIPLGHINPPVDHHPRDDQGASMGYISHRYTTRKRDQPLRLPRYDAKPRNLDPQ